MSSPHLYRVTRGEGMTLRMMTAVYILPNESEVAINFQQNNWISQSCPINLVCKIVIEKMRVKIYCWMREKTNMNISFNWMRLFFQIQIKTWSWYQRNLSVMKDECAIFNSSLYVLFLTVILWCFYTVLSLFSWWLRSSSLHESLIFFLRVISHSFHYSAFLFPRYSPP